MTYPIVRMPRKHTRGKTPLGAQRVNECPYQLRVAKHHIRQVRIATGVVRTYKVVVRAFARGDQSVLLAALAPPSQVRRRTKGR